MSNIDDYDPSVSLSAYFASRTSTRLARLWAVEKAVHDLAAAGVVQMFEGAGTDPTGLTGYANTKLWLNVSAGVTAAPGVVRYYDGTGDETDINNWPELDLEGMRSHLSVYSIAEVDAMFISGLPTLSSDNFGNDSGVTGVTITNALDTLLATFANYIPLTQKAANNGVAPLDANGYVPDANINPTYRQNFQFEGAWDASTNTPALSDGSGSAGQVYRVSVADASRTLDGLTGFIVGEEIYHDDVAGVWRRMGKDTTGSGGGGSSSTHRHKPTDLPASLDGRCAMYRIRYVVVNDSEVWATGYHGEQANGTNPGIETKTYLPVRFNVAHSGTIVKLVVGSFSAAVLDSDGNVFTIGRNTEGQLGHGDNTDRGEFTRVEYFVTNSKTITDIDAADQDEQNEEMFAAIDDTGQLYTWGYNGRGNLGIGNTTNQNTPQSVSGMTTVTDVKIGGSGGCFCFAIKTDNTLWSCGYNGYGQLGHGDTTQRTSFTQVSLITSASKIVPVASYAAANLYGFTLLLMTTGHLYACGYNGYGQLGVGDTTNRSSFTQVGTDTDWADVFGHNGNYGNAAAIKDNGDVYVWGDNTRGQLGDGTTVARSSPFKPTTGDAADFALKGSKVLFTAMSNDGGIIVLDTDGHAYGAGYSAAGQIGLPDAAATSTEFQKIVTPGGLTFKKLVAVGSTQICGLSAILSDDSFAVCGYASAGMLGMDHIATSQHIYQLQKVPQFA